MLMLKRMHMQLFLYLFTLWHFFLLGEHLRICERGLTCCTEEMEHKLSTHSRVEFDKLLHSAIGELKDIFETHTHKFDGKYT